MTMTALVNANSYRTPLRSKSVHLVAFSPPYWSKRVYSGDDDDPLGLEPVHDCLSWANGYANVSQIIATMRGVYNHPVDAELKLNTIIGMLEDIEESMRKPSPPCGRCFVCNIRLIAQEMHRVLRDDGIMWINLGDSFYGGKGRSAQAWSGSHTDRQTIQKAHDHISGKGTARPSDLPNPTLKQKNLAGIPFRVAMALQADGWYWRTIAPWLKPSCMPESVTDRPSVAHEQVMMFTKSKMYYYDAQAIKEPLADSTLPRMLRGRSHNKYSEAIPGQSVNSVNRALPKGEVYKGYDASGRGRRTTDWATESMKIGVVESATWAQQAMKLINGEVEGVLVNGEGNVDAFVVNPDGWPGDHYAVWPGELVKPMILSGTSEYGCCPKCGAQWKRITKKSRVNRPDNPNDVLPYEANSGHTHGKGKTSLHKITTVETICFLPSCKCHDFLPSYPDVGEWENADLENTTLEDRMEAILSVVPDEFRPIPCTVLDPFAGSGTTLEVARSLGRNAIGLDLSFEYLNQEAKVRLDIDRLELWEKGWGKSAKEAEKLEALPLLSLMGV